MSPTADVLPRLPKRAERRFASHRTVEIMAKIKDTPDIIIYVHTFVVQIRGYVHMMSAMGGRGGTPKADEITDSSICNTYMASWALFEKSYGPMY